ncbi:MAG: hypothetical protein ACP5XB_14065 [Isosphaeraceae bacterium]
MASRRSQDLVIDASVAQAAGPQSAVHPTSKNCRDFLLAVLHVCHRATFSPEIAKEWNDHQSGFALQWRRSMFAREKINRIDSPKDKTLRDKIIRAAVSQKQQEAMLKDVHLIEAALRGGMRVAALDETARGYFRSASASVPSLRSICWINPTAPKEEPLPWLESGAYPDDFRRLGHTTGVE